MKKLIPPKKVREEFLVTYELKGCQKAVDLLTGCYEIKRLKIILDGRRVGNGHEAIYFDCKAHFKKKTLNKDNVLHELYHHIVSMNGLDMSERSEERKANSYASKMSAFP